jgi:DNA-binding IclR family transcriptional regulator
MTADISSSAGKALETLKVISSHGAPCSLADIARATGYPRTVALRMVMTLVSHGFVERDPENHLFSVTLDLLHMVQKAISRDPMLSRVELMLRAIAEETGDTASFMVRRRNFAVVIRRVEGSSIIRVGGSREGMELPLHCGAAPFALLAFSADAEIDAYLAGPLVKRTAASITDPAELRRRIAEARARGFTVGNEDLFEYIIAVGAPVPDAQGALGGAISVGNIPQRYPPGRAEEVGLQLVRTIARY